MKSSTKKIVAITSVVVLVLSGFAAAAGIISNQSKKDDAGFEAYINGLKNANENANIERNKQAFALGQSQQPRIVYETEEEITNALALDHINLLTKYNGYIKTDAYWNYSNFENLKTNKHLTVYLGANLSKDEKESVTNAVKYLNHIFSTINPEMSIKITNTLEHNPTCIHIQNGYLDNNTLGITYCYDANTPQGKDTIIIKLANNLLQSRYGTENMYSFYYTVVAMHEIFHACGYDHNLDTIRYQYDYATLMQTAVTGKSIEAFSPMEIAGLFYNLNKEKYEKAKNNGNLEEVVQEDIQKYLNLLQYSADFAKLFSISATERTVENDNQMFRIKFEDNKYRTDLNTMQNCTVKITFNSPCKNLCVQDITFSDGTTKQIVSPFVYSNVDGKGRIRVLSENWYDIDYDNIYEQESDYEVLKENLTFEELQEEAKNFNPQYNYRIVAGKKEYTFEEFKSQNLWQKLQNKSTIHTYGFAENKYTIEYQKYDWVVQKCLDTSKQQAEDITNEIEFEEESEN